MVKLGFMASLLLLGAGVGAAPAINVDRKSNQNKGKSLPVIAFGKVGPSTFYNAEHKLLYDQKSHPLKGTPLNLHYGLLPAGTEGEIESHKDVFGLIMGDSYASPLAGVFNDIALDRNIKFALTSHPSCAAFFDKVSMDPNIQDWPASLKSKKDPYACKAYRRQEMFELIKRSKAKVVFLSPNWEAASQIWQVKKMMNQKSKDVDPVSETLIKLSRTGKKIVLFGVVPGVHVNIRSCLARDGEYAKKLKWIFGCPKESKITPPFQGAPMEIKRMERRSEARDILARVLTKKEIKALNIDFIDPKASMCTTDDKCMVSMRGQPLYSDTMHLTVLGGKLMRAAVEKVLDKYSTVLAK